MIPAPQDVTVRRLARDDMDAAARVHRAAFDDRLPWLTGLHTPDDDRAYFRGHVFEACEAWGAFSGADLVGFIAFREGWIDQLYVLPGKQGSGIGSRLLQIVQTDFPTLSLWTFQQNAGARTFYQAHGFKAAQFTDGSGNEEREPDVRYDWTRL
jgi:ribosomal protein S18 acetylase RimI-like enzyme